MVSAVAPDPALVFVEHAVDEAAARIPQIDRHAMVMVLLLHRVTNAVVYDLESTVHRPAGESWSAFRPVFTLWISGPLEPSRLAAASGMSRQAVSSLAKTLEQDGLVERRTAGDPVAATAGQLGGQRTHLSDQLGLGIEGALRVLEVQDDRSGLAGFADERRI